MSLDRALATAIRSKVLADAGVQAVLGDPVRLYDDPPLDPQFPYATLGRVEARDADASGAGATEFFVTLHVWSRHGGRAEALDAVGALRTALHNMDLSVADASLVFIYAIFSDVFRDGDGRTTHGVLRLRALAEPV